MAIYIHQGDMKSQIHQILKSRNLAQFLRQESKILHVISKSIPQQYVYSNMGSQPTPSLISQGRLQKPPPPPTHRICTPSEVGLNNLSYLMISQAISCLFGLSLAIKIYLRLYHAILCSPWLYLAYLGYIWLSLAIFGNFQIYVDISGYFCRYQATWGFFYSYLWLCLVISVYLWLYQAILVFPGYVRMFQAISGYLCLFPSSIKYPGVSKRRRQKVILICIFFSFFCTQQLYEHWYHIQEYHQIHPFRPLQNFFIQKYQPSSKEVLTHRLKPQQNPKLLGLTLGFLVLA